jgi:hypothetical protein
VDENIDVRSLDALICFRWSKNQKQQAALLRQALAVYDNGASHIEHLWYGRPAIR